MAKFARVARCPTRISSRGAAKAVEAQTLSGCADIAIEGTTVKTCTGIALTIDTLALPAGDIEVKVQNPASARCTASATGVLRISDAPAPIVFFMDPPVAYNGMSIEATIFTSGLSAKAASVELVHEDGTTREPISDFDSPERPSKILALVPAGLKPGAWDVVVTSDAGCGGTLEDGLTITSTLDDALLASVAPSYVSSTHDTAVTVSGSGFVPVHPARHGSLVRAVRVGRVHPAQGRRQARRCAAQRTGQLRADPTGRARRRAAPWTGRGATRGLDELAKIDGYVPRDTSAGALGLSLGYRLFL